MRTLILTAAMIALLGQPVHAQMKGDKSETKTPQQIIDEQKRRDQAEIDRQYEQRVKAPAPAAKEDPWSTIRPADSSRKR